MPSSSAAPTPPMLSMETTNAVHWPERSWPLRYLSEAQYNSWASEGYLVIQDAVEQDKCIAAANAVKEFIGADDDDPDSWYKNTLDIYSDVEADGSKPVHGPCGMVQLFHHASFWSIRQSVRLHAIFSDLYGSHELYVTTDRAHFKPPERAEHPKWSMPGDEHSGLHWDVRTDERHWPVPFGIQGVVYLEDTAAEQGPLHVVPGFHRQLQNWSKSQPADRSGRKPSAASLPLSAAVGVAAPAGSLVIWHSALPHGPGRHVGTRPRVSFYVSYLPVDATAYVGAGRDATAPLNLADAGTIAYEDDPGRVSRLTRAERADRWRLRLPLLAEDPCEGELSRPPPGEEGAPPAALGALGRQLVGIDPWAHASRAHSDDACEAATQRETGQEGAE